MPTLSCMGFSALPISIKQRHTDWYVKHCAPRAIATPTATSTPTQYVSVKIDNTGTIEDDEVIDNTPSAVPCITATQIPIRTQEAHPTFKSLNLPKLSLTAVMGGALAVSAVITALFVNCLKKITTPRAALAVQTDSDSDNDDATDIGHGRPPAPPPGPGFGGGGSGDGSLLMRPRGVGFQEDLDDFKKSVAVAAEQAQVAHHAPVAAFTSYTALAPRVTTATGALTPGGDPSSGSLTPAAFPIAQQVPAVAVPAVIEGDDEEDLDDAPPTHEAAEEYHSPHASEEVGVLDISGAVNNGAGEDA